MASPAGSGLSEGRNGGWKFGNDVQVLPLRSVDEFLLGKARFELPPFRDFARWNNRILVNLLYFQTNYFAISLTFLLLSSILNARDVILGASAIGILAAAIVYSISSYPAFAATREQHPVLTLCGIVLSSYYFIYMITAVITVLFTLAIPLLLILFHASVRLRDLKAKINHKLEYFGLKATVMARLLEMLSIDMKMN